jgi:transglutaminase-like putative cysteine protease
MKRGLARFWDFPSAAILTLLLFTVSERLFATDWAPGLEIAIFLAVFGVLLGLGLGASQFKPGVVFWLAFGYTITLIPLVAAGIFYQHIPWLERMLNLSGRLGTSLFQFISAQPVPDTILFVIFAGLGFWLVSILAGFSFTNGGDLISAVLPAGIILFVIQLYNSGVGDSVIILAIFAFLSLLLLGRLTYVRKRLFWKAQRVSFSAESWTDINIAIPVAALVLVVVAWLTPATGRPVVAAKVAWENITRPWEKLRHDLSNAVFGLKGSQPGTIVDIYGDTLPLGQNASTSDKIYLRISAPLFGKADRYYWRVRAYDQYVNNQWESIYSYTEPFTPDQASIPLTELHAPGSEFIFSTSRVNMGLLVTPAHPLWVSRPSVLTFAPAMEDKIDPLMFRADPPILTGEQYVVHASIYNPTVFQLQQAGAIYPAWVGDHYLQLPSNLSPQITQLARRITRDADTPYDKAIAITNYLRDTITYTTTVNIPQEDTDPLVWFLFDGRKGFCNYYATAEVILLRSLGIPSRMVVGFAEGEYQPPDKYTILEKDAHAWPEVYFPGIGWVEFEPTSSQPVLNRNLGNPTATEEPFNATQNAGQNAAGQTPTPRQEAGSDSGSRSSANSFLRLMLLFISLVAIIAAVVVAYSSGLLDKILRRTRLTSWKPFPVVISSIFSSLSLNPPTWLLHWAFISSQSPIERYFRIIFQSLRWLGSATSPAQTPAEAAAILTRYLPAGTEEVDTLLREYQNALFSQKHTNLVVAQHSGNMIRRRALSLAFQQRVNSFRHMILSKFSRKLE